MSINKLELRDSIENSIRNYESVLSYKQPEYQVWKGAYSFYSSLLADSDVQKNLESLDLVCRLGNALLRAYIRGILTHLHSEILTDEQKEIMTVCKKKISNDLNAIEFSKSVIERVAIMSTNVVTYPLWSVYYTQYKDLRERASRENYEGFDLLADRLGQGLVTVEVVPLIPDEEALIETYKGKIKKDLGVSKKYEDK